MEEKALKVLSGVDALDLALVLVMLWLVWHILRSPDLFKAAVLFITFGLVMSLAWVRLDAPDIALAEAAIGAGITGVLVLDALGSLRADRASRGGGEGGPDDGP